MLCANLASKENLLKASDLHLDIAFQPIVDARTGSVHGYEALTCYVDRLGHASPLHLLDQAADMGCLPDLNSLLQSKALEKYAKLKREREILYLNVDARLFDKDLLTSLYAHLRQHGLTPADICLELTETYPLNSLDAFLPVQQHWKQQGGRLALDDFGQGHSGLRTLVETSADVVKIDRFFITELQCNRKKQLIVAAITDLCHKFGMKIIAEGVETLEEGQICQDFGCDFLQGYFIARPTPDLNLLDRTAYPAMLN